MRATIFDGHTQRPYTDQDAEALKKSTPYAWIDVIAEQTGDHEVAQLLQQMGFSEIVAAYTTRAYTSGMFQVFGDSMLGSTFAAADTADDPLVLVHCAWNAGCLVTIRRGGDAAVAAAFEHIKHRASVLFANPGPIPGLVMQLILDSVDRQLTGLQTRIALLDEQIIETSKPQQLSVLQGLRKTVETLGTTVPAYAENVKESLVDPATLPGVGTDGVHALLTYSACVNDIVQRIDGAASDIRSAIQDYQGQVSAAQGDRINQLTLVSIVFLPISFLTGYFGMNFQWLVNETQSFATWFLLGAVLPVVCVVGSVALLRKRGYHIGRFVIGHNADRSGNPPG